MFSEYASRFLQQSTAGLPFTQQDVARSRSRSSLNRQRNPTSQSRYVQRPPSRFPFASQQAPLFYSATNDFPEDDESDERGREIDYLQGSRQHFGRSNLTESSELEEDGMEGFEEAQKGQNHDRDDHRARGRMDPPVRSESVSDSEPSHKGKSRLVDVNLESTIHEDPSESLANISPSPSISQDNPPVTPFRFNPRTRSSGMSSFMPVDTDDEPQMGHPRPSSQESISRTIIRPSEEPPRHDAFWASIFTISLCAMFAAFILVWFQTSAPGKNNPLGDTIYSAIRGSTNMLVWDTLIAIVVSLIWLSLLRNHVRVLVFVLVVAVPVILFAFSLYPLISSFKGSWHGNAVQDKVMRWFSFVPAVMAAFWTWSVIKNRHSLDNAIRILEFSTKVLATNSYLLVLGFATLSVVVLFSWTWLLMFERVFLSGSFAGAKKFVLYANSWWLGAFFVLQFLWSLGVIAGVQRATTAATVSQWYFHRGVVPQPTSQEVVKASFNHATGAFFGTVCLGTFLSLLVRLPLIVLPGRLSGLLNMAAYWIMPTGLATLTNPLTLTYAAIFSQPLGISARNMAQLNFVSRTNPSSTLGPRNFNPSGQGNTLMGYRLSKLVLQATRWIMSFALGFGGWVRAAHSIKLDGTSAGIRGSLYAYIVGMIAGTIGFAVMGAVENLIGGIVDAAVICWASDSGGGQNEARFCREAGELFGEEGRLNLNQRSGMA